ncbi:Pleckstrin -like proteiny domain-containing family O member 2 [Triplophysa tibetana]|uniref:Pleckstrin-like proteiny domain-containing family O member 2 n=1 Tax=Triplophysa tibetana TaxID=1572043 RepID=A0A5A9PM28_9TELE|nr:Pleckstrin -like proteiny domain-containing family O member 2 [Triplophysa tibetana]
MCCPLCSKLTQKQNKENKEQPSCAKTPTTPRVLIAPIPAQTLRGDAVTCRHVGILDRGVKEEPSKPKEVKCAGKAGWLKKSSGKFLSSYKDRYIQLDRTEIAIYEDEELKTCLEKLDLENYEKCHELKSAFKKKHRLVLIRNPKSANKVQVVKFQAQTPDEKEAWIKALNEGINKAKNKVFDEVKVDEGCSLEHVTRSRPKGNRSRRPPTRIHMKEVASVTSDGIIRLDLDGDVTQLNGTHCLNTEDDKQTETLKPPVTLNDIAEEDVDQDSTSQKKVIKPPMPPSKDRKPSDNRKEDETKSEEPTEPIPPKKILTPPMPPSKGSKPCVSTNDVSSYSKVDSESSDISEPTPSSKTIQPPAPPSKHMKPNQQVETERQETQEELEEGDGEDMPDISPDSTKQNMNEDQPFTLTNKIIKPQVVMWDSPTSASKEPNVEQEGKDSQKTSDSPGEVTTEPLKLNVTPLATPEAVKKCSRPPAPPKKPLKQTVQAEDSSPQNYTTALTIVTTPSSEKVSEQSLDKGDKTSPEPKLEPTEDLEDKSLDSGQHSGEESEIGDQFTPSKSKLKGSSQGLEGETSEDDLDPSDGKAESSNEPSLEMPTVTPKSSAPNQCVDDPNHFTVPLKQSSKARSTSLGELLSQNTENKEDEEKERAVNNVHRSDVNALQTKVSFEIAETEEMLSVIATGQSSQIEESESPEILLNAAMEKLKKADQFLREARGFKDHNKSNRLSLEW